MLRLKFEYIALNIIIKVVKFTHYMLIIKHVNVNIEPIYRRHTELIGCEAPFLCYY